MERTGVLIENGVVCHHIVWSDESEAQYEADGWDHAIETTGLEPRPSQGWSWSESDGFRPPAPHASWNWNGTDWIAPKPMPTDGGPYQWNETTSDWDPISVE